MKLKINYQQFKIVLITNEKGSMRIENSIQLFS